jgi:Domain of unknown function (DUF4166)
MNAFIDHLGQDYIYLGTLVKQAHIGTIRLEGMATVRRGNWFAARLCGLLGLPRNADAVRLVVIGQHLPDRIIWSRNFGGVKMTSCFIQDGVCLVERMGPVGLWLTLTVDNGVLRYRLIRTSFWNITLPSLLQPSLTAFEADDNGLYSFSVRIDLPLIGMLIEYSGKLILTPQQ